MSCASVIKQQFHALLERAGPGHIVLYDAATHGILLAYRDTDSINAVECKAEGPIGDKQPSAPVPVVYFLYPTATNVTCVVDDLHQRPYSKFHLVFLTALSPNDRQVITEAARALRRDVAIHDNFLAFSVPDSRVAVTNQADAIVALSSNTRDEWVDCIMSAVASLLLALGEQPCIRYATSGARTGSGKAQHAEMQDITYRAATVLQQHLRSATNRPLVHRPEGTADALIIHRGFDLISALIHDPTLEAVLHDLHPPGAPSYEDAEGNLLEMPQPVGEQQQQLWEEMRHLPAKQASDLLVDIEEDIRAAQARAKEEKSAAAVREVLDREPRRTAAQALFRHLRLRWQRIQGLLALGRAERQVVANAGRDAEDVAMRVLEKYEYPNRDDVVRLLVICRWAVGRPLASPKLQYLAGPELRTAEKVVQHLEGRLQWTRTWRQALAPQAPKSPRGAAPPPPATLPPLLSHLLQAAAANALPPHLLPPLPTDPSETRRNNLRVGFDWASRTLTDGPDPSVNTRRLVVVVLGGLAPAEIRLGHQLSRQLHRNILLVSTSLQHPNELVHFSFHHAPAPPSAPPSTPPGSPYGSRGATPTFDPYRPATPPTSPPPHPSHHHHHAHPHPHPQPPLQQPHPQQAGHRLFPSRNRAGAPGHQRYASNPDALNQMRLSPELHQQQQQPPPAAPPRHAATPPPARPTHHRRLSDPQALHEVMQQPPTSTTPPPAHTSPDPNTFSRRPRSPMPPPYPRASSPNPPPSPPATGHAPSNPFRRPNPPDAPSHPHPRHQPTRDFSPLSQLRHSPSSPPLADSGRSRTPPPVAPSSRLRRVGANHARHTSEILQTSSPPVTAYPQRNAGTNFGNAWAGQAQPPALQPSSSSASGYSASPQPSSSSASGYSPSPQAAPVVPRRYTLDGPNGAQPLPAAQYQPQLPYQGDSSSTGSSSKAGWLKKAIRKF